MFQGTGVARSCLSNEGNARTATRPIRLVLCPKKLDQRSLLGCKARQYGGPFARRRKGNDAPTIRRWKNTHNVTA